MRIPRLALAIGASLSLVLAATGTVSASKSERHLNMLDDCDAVTFNAIIGPGTCSKDGGTTFFEFVGQLGAMGQAPAWRFAPSTMKLPAGGSIEAYNRGGELHTFTEVANYGGGCVQVLDDILGLTPVPECANFPALIGTTGAAPGDEVETNPLPAGVHLFECLIHPWMRTTVTVN
jgi:plastocyanin